MLGLLIPFAVFQIARFRRKCSRKRSLAYAGAAYLLWLAAYSLVLFILAFAS